MKKVIVTGGNKGIGKAICKLLLEEHPSIHVVLASRSLSRGQEAAADLQKEVGDDRTKGRLDVLELDVSSDESVKTAAAAFVDSSLFGIVNNAGVGWNHPTKDVINTNYFGPRRVNDHFRTKIERPGGRIVNVSSAAGPMFAQGADPALKKKFGEPWTMIPNSNKESCKDAIAEMDKLAHSEGEKVEGFKAYGFSKALLSAYTWWHSRSEPELVIHCITPGFIDTDMTKKMGATNSPSKGAVPPVFLLMNEELDKLPKGRFFGSDCKRSPLDKYRDPGTPEYDGSDGPF